VIQKARCGHLTRKSYAETHGGLCRKCQSNFTFIVELEKKHGEDALVQYWYSMILASLPESKDDVQCFVSHLVEFYESKLAEWPSKKSYVEKMLYMLRSIQEPSQTEDLK
jgi:hypothetical protein